MERERERERCLLSVEGKVFHFFPPGEGGGGFVGGW